MKKIILFISISISSYTNIFASLNITKSDGGLLGYRTVNQTTNDGHTTVFCGGSGRNKCKYVSTARMISLDASGAEISVNDVEDIQTSVDVLIKDTSFGSFMYNDSFFVKYFYDEESGNHSLIIYSRAEATALNLI